ncbi:hypothetical protein AAU61_08980 [Desulfocarbo indianensis]|nr:hypothetical protein AAU61_08980 [Desulfocarbo indianensis]
MLALLLSHACAGAPPEEAKAPATVGPAPRLSADVQAALDAGDAELRRGRQAKAEVLYQRALQNSEGSQGQSRAMVGLARVELAKGQARKALEWLERLAEPEENQAAQAEAAWLQAFILYQKGDQDGGRQALRHLVSLSIMGIPPEEREQAASYLETELIRGRGDFAFLRSLLYSARRQGSLAARDLPPLIARQAASLPPGQAAGLVRIEPDRELRAALTAGLAWGYIKEGQAGEAKQAIDYLAASPQGGQWRYWLSALRQDLSQAGRMDARTIGVILPLTGLHGEKGRRVLLAIKLALGVFQEPAKAPALYVMDSRSNPLTADQAVKDLAERHRAAVIIGPLEHMTALAAARRAQALEVPLICLAPEADLSRVGAFIFRNHPTVEDQVAAIMPKVQGEGTSRVALLAPDDQEGHAFHETLSAWFAAQQSDPARSHTISYGMNPLTMDPPLFYRPGGAAQAKLERLVGGASTKAVINFDRLWLPAPVEDVQHLAPRLHNRGVRGKLLLGSMAWHDPKLLASSGKLLQDAMFPDVFDPESSRGAVRAFCQSFEKETGQAPGLLEALGHDAALLARKALDSIAPTEGRPAVRRALASLKGVEGACGPLAMGRDGRVRAPMKLFLIRESAFVSLGPAASPER